MRVTELADRLRAKGLTVVEHAGWQTRGNDFSARPQGALRHWTAGARTGVLPSLNVLLYGRAGLPGPLCNVAQDRQPDGNDRVHVIAAGKANHAGAGVWRGISGNYKLLGLEIEWSGPNEAFSAKRKLVSEKIMTVLIECTQSKNPQNAAEHREYAPTRKIDTNLSGDELRSRIAQLLGSTGSPSPVPSKSSKEYEDMHLPAMVVKSKTDSKVYITDWVTKQHIKNSEHLKIMQFLGSAKMNNGKPYMYDQGVIDSIRTVA